MRDAAGSAGSRLRQTRSQPDVHLFQKPPTHHTPSGRRAGKPSRAEIRTSAP